MSYKLTIFYTLLSVLLLLKKTHQQQWCDGDDKIDPGFFSVWLIKNQNSAGQVEIHIQNQKTIQKDLTCPNADWTVPINTQLPTYLRVHTDKNWCQGQLQYNDLYVDYNSKRYYTSNNTLCQQDRSFTPLDQSYNNDVCEQSRKDTKQGSNSVRCIIAEQLVGPELGEKPSPPGGEKPSPPGGEKPSPPGGDNNEPDEPSPPGGDKPSPPGGEKPTPPGGDKPSPPGGDKPSPPGGDKPSPPGGDKPSPPGGDNNEPDEPSPPGGDKPSPPGGDKPSPPGGDKPSPPGGDKPSPPGGDKPSPPGGDKPSPPGGEKPSPPGGDKPSPPGGDNNEPDEPEEDKQCEIDEDDYTSYDYNQDYDYSSQQSSEQDGNSDQPPQQPIAPSQQIPQERFQVTVNPQWVQIQTYDGKTQSEKTVCGGKTTIPTGLLPSYVDVITTQDWCQTQKPSPEQARQPPTEPSQWNDGYGQLQDNEFTVIMYQQSQGDQDKNGSGSVQYKQTIEVHIKNEQPIIKLVQDCKDNQWTTIDSVLPHTIDVGVSDAWCYYNINTFLNLKYKGLEIDYGDQKIIVADSKNCSSDNFDDQKKLPIRCTFTK